MKLPLVLRYGVVGWTNIELLDALTAAKKGVSAALPRYRPSWLVSSPRPRAPSSWRA